MFQVDLLVFGKSLDKIDRKMLKMTARLKKPFAINESKSQPKTPFSKSFLGYSVSADGIKSDEQFDNEVWEAESPTTMKKLVIFCGILSF